MQHLTVPLQRLHSPTGHNLTTVYYKGQPCWIAQEIGQALGYSSSGSKLVNKITQDWAEEAIEGEDFFKVEGEEMAALREAVSHFASPESGDANFASTGAGVANLIGPKVRNLLLLTEQGVYLACIKSNKPAGVQLRRWLVSEVLPALRQTGTYTTATASSGRSSREARRLPAGKTRISIDVPEELAEELRAICFWRGGQVTAAVGEAVAAWVQTKRAAKDFFIDPETRQPIEKPAGELYPARTGELKQGRPVGS